MTNPHEAADKAHILAKELSALIEHRLHDAIQALDNRAALAAHWEGVANAQRETITRLQAEKANLSAHLETVATERDELMQRVMELEKRLKGQTNDDLC